MVTTCIKEFGRVKRVNFGLRVRGLGLPYFLPCLDSIPAIGLAICIQQK